jgi:dolichol-phosphate mannosyltransferase
MPPGRPVPDKKFSKKLDIDWLWILIGFGVLIRLFFIGNLNLLPEEAYYWNYSQHLATGYLDHPPMVAWLNYLSEAALGRSELAVRLPAFLGWFLFAYFMYRFTVNTVGAKIGKPVLLLLAALPIYLSIGFLMTPDAPFYVCWAGSLFFLERAIIAERQTAWIGAGVFLGLGLLSKYTMGLILPATAICLLIDKKSRRWFGRPQPYLALLLGLFLFLPNIDWNARHDWVSFAFQGSRRWTDILIGSILILITPLGLYEAVRSLLALWRRRSALRDDDKSRYRQYLFMATFTLVPLVIFIIHSLQGQPKLNWTGPVWLAILPLVAARMAGIGDFLWQRPNVAFSRSWIVTISALLIFYAAGFSYMVAGMPGLGNRVGLKLPIAWRAYGVRLDEIKSRLESTTHSEPVIIGADKYWLASEARFYTSDKNDTVPEVGADNLVGGYSLMWNFWVPPRTIAGRDALLVSLSRNHLDHSRVTERFTQLGDITREVLSNSWGETGHFYWRIGYDYKPK